MVRQIALAGALLVFGTAIGQAQPLRNIPGHEIRRDRREIRADHRELRRDRRDLRHDRWVLDHDKHKKHKDHKKWAHKHHQYKAPASTNKNTVWWNRNQPKPTTTHPVQAPRTGPDLGKVIGK